MFKFFKNLCFAVTRFVIAIISVAGTMLILGAPIAVLGLGIGTLVGICSSCTIEFGALIGAGIGAIIGDCLFLPSCFSQNNFPKKKPNNLSITVDNEKEIASSTISSIKNIDIVMKPTTPLIAQNQPMSKNDPLQVVRAPDGDDKFTLKYKEAPCRYA